MKLKGRWIDLELVGVVKGLPCLSCAKMGGDAHHVYHQGAGGPDYYWNLMPLCREHHSECHQIGLNKFAMKYGAVEHWLLKAGWEFDQFRDKWRHNE